MKLNRNAKPKADAGQILDGVYQLAVSISIESRRRVRHELDDVLIEELPPHGGWLDVLREREAAGHAARLHAAAKSLARSASAGMRPYVASAAGRLVEAVGDLMSWCPEHELRPVRVNAPGFTRSLGIPDGWQFLNWTPTEASMARLDELRHRVWAAFVGVEELLKDYPDTAARVLVVAKRIAGRLLEPTDARLVTEWLAKLAA